MSVERETPTERVHVEGERERATREERIERCEEEKLFALRNH